MARVIRVVLAALILLPLLAPAASIEIRQFDDPVTERRYQELTATLRCPKCENQAIGDSDSPIAGDMRDRVYEQLQDGRSDKEILDFMVRRFGDYVQRHCPDVAARFPTPASDYDEVRIYRCEAPEASAGIR